jgi:uncharacterized RDD family membrane protein YckC
MMNDSVREELEAKITSGRLRPTPPTIEAKPVRMETPAPVDVTPAPAIRRPEPPIVAASPIRRIETADLNTPRTSPTLVEFQSAKATLPDWRLQIQNAVQQRVGSTANVDAKPAAVAPVINPRPAKIEMPTTDLPDHSDPRMASAMKRITESRKAFLPKTPVMRPVTSQPVQPLQARPFNLVPARPSAAPVPHNSMSGASASSARALKVDTNKLPKLESVVEHSLEPAPKAAPSIVLVDKPTIARVEALPEPVEQQRETEFAQIGRIRIKAENIEIEASEQTEQYVDDIEDLAPFSMRFGAGLFDLIIGGFVAMLLLSPIAFSGGNWLTPIGGLTFAGAWTVVMFVYMTASLGFYGKTMGMRLFSLELVDAVENQYPTLQQAAVNSAMFLLLLPLAGAGFATIFFNEENRAAHDLLSGTILVREF